MLRKRVWNGNKWRKDLQTSAVGRALNTLLIQADSCQNLGCFAGALDVCFFPCSSRQDCVHTCKEQKYRGQLNQIANFFSVRNILQDSVFCIQSFYSIKNKQIPKDKVILRLSDHAVYGEPLVSKCQSHYKEVNRRF